MSIPRPQRLLFASILATVATVASGCGAQIADDGETVDQGLPASSEGACPGETADAAQARAAIARVRARAGLAPLTCDAAATRAATGHCRYLSLNHEFAHTQSPGKPGFTGATMQDRLAREGFRSDPAGEVLATLTGAAALDDPGGFINSVYHRPFFLRTETTVFGYGSTEGCATFDFGRPKGAVAAKARTVWPPDGSTGFPRAFRADRESPSPIPGAKEVGAPVSLITTEPLASVTASLQGPGGPVAAVVLTAANDPAKLVRAGEVHLIPRAPLAARTRYEVVFRANVGNQPLTVRASFVTGD
ncbi:MAG: CAP domain-containing protein [Deltaproteobacteria bacterium]|nr:CAP domain-containing protein [Deltaproteobacteria bacterium]